MQVGSEIGAGGENAFAFLAFAFAEKLFPPFPEIEQAGFEIGQQFHFFALLHIQVLAEERVLGGYVAGPVQFFGAEQFLHALSALGQFPDVDARQGQGEQSDRGQHRIAASYVVRHDKGGVAFLVGQGLQRAFFLVGDNRDPLAGFLFAVFLFDMFADQAEGDGRLSGRPGFGNDADGIVIMVQGRKQFTVVVFAELVAGKNDPGIAHDELGQLGCHAFH